MKISVAIATYNGASYLREQLESISNQRHLPFELVACDDGSTDETIEVLTTYSQTAPFPVRLYRNETNLGYAENFLKAARLCKGEWVAFCDQDDVWLPNKLDDARSAIEKDDRPIMVLQNAYICDEHLKHSDRLFPNRLKKGYYAPHSQYGFWVWLGFLQTVRSDIFHLSNSQKLPSNYFPGHQQMSHDKWTCLIANTVGGFQVVDEPAALYRRHPQAATGAYIRKNFATRIMESIPVPGEHYRFLSGVAEETKKYLNEMAHHAGVDTKPSFEKSARAFQRISQIQEARAQLYNVASFTARAERFIKIMTIGGYIGPSNFALGWKSAAKDLMCVAGILASSRKDV